jgi:hypothetical protein
MVGLPVSYTLDGPPEMIRPREPSSACAGSFARSDFSVDAQIADSASDEVAILPSGVEDRDLGTQDLF